MPLQPMITGARYMIAAGIALGVVHSDQVQFAGVAPMLVYLAERDEVVSRRR